MPNVELAGAMILAAGRGERMRPLTDKLPKPLLPVKGQALIVYHLKKLAQQGVKKVVINIAWLGEKIQQHLGDGSLFGLEIVYSDEQQSALETAGGIVKALPLLADQFWVINADIYTDYQYVRPDLSDFMAQLVLVENPSFHPNGDFGLEGETLLAQAQTQYTFSGIGYYSQAFFANLSQGKRPLAPLIRQFASTKKVKGTLFSGVWSDVGTVQRLEALEK